MTIVDPDFFERTTECWTYPRLTKLESVGVSAKQYMSFLDEPADNDEPLRLYLHIPYCKQFCVFCPYYKKSFNGTESSEKTNLARSFAREIEIYARKPQLKNRKVTTIYFGGGDPGIFPEADYEIIFKALHDNFDIVENADTTLEGTAMSFLNLDKVKFLRDLGVTRASFGLQTFDEVLRPRLNLEPTVKQIYEAVHNIQTAGITDMSLDMMYNLPGQTDESLDRDLHLVNEIGARYIDFYALNLYPNTTYFRKVRKGAFGRCPSSQVEIAMWRRITAVMNASGYQQVSSVTFSKSQSRAHEGFEHTLKGLPMLGLGPSSRSYVSGRNFRNVPSVSTYIAKLAEDSLPIESAAVYSEDEARRVPFVLFPIRLRLDWMTVEKTEELRDVVDLLISRDLAELDGRELVLTAEGRVWAGNIQRLFFSETERRNEKQLLLTALKEKVNPYNFDKMGVAS